MMDRFKIICIILAVLIGATVITLIIIAIKRKKKTLVNRVENLLGKNDNFKKRTEFLLDESRTQVKAIIKDIELYLQKAIKKKVKRIRYSTKNRSIEKISYNVDVGITNISFLGWWFTTPPYSEKALSDEEISSFKEIIKNRIENNAKTLLEKYYSDERLKGVQISINVDKSGDLSVIFSAEIAIDYT